MSYLLDSMIVLWSVLYWFTFMQHGNDSCLAYTLAAICNLLSEIGISSTSRLLGSSYSLTASIGTSFSVQQQLFMLLRESLKRAESLKLKRLVASNHLTLAKFHLMVRLEEELWCGIWWHICRIEPTFLLKFSTLCCKNHLLLLNLMCSMCRDQSCLSGQKLPWNLKHVQSMCARLHDFHFYCLPILDNMCHLFIYFGGLLVPLTWNVSQTLFSTV